MESVIEKMLVSITGDPVPFDLVALREGIESAQDCAQACIACADACRSDGMEELTACVRVLLNTADVCDVTARVLQRRTGPEDPATRALVAACWAACRRARDVLEEFLPVHHHCGVCARVCRAAELACRALLASGQDERSAASARRAR